MTRRSLTGLALAVIMAVPVGAEVPPMSEDQLSQAADLVVSGRVVAVRVSQKKWTTTAGNFADANYTVVIDVNSIEKGDIGGHNHQIEFHAWREVKRPRGLVGDGGTLQTDLKRDDNVKIYLKRGAVAWELFSRSGISVLH